MGADTMRFDLDVDRSVRPFCVQSPNIASPLGDMSSLRTSDCRPPSELGVPRADTDTARHSSIASCGHAVTEDQCCGDGSRELIERRERLHAGEQLVEGGPLASRLSFVTWAGSHFSLA